MLTTTMNYLLGLLMLTMGGVAWASEDAKMGPPAKKIPYDSRVFLPDPSYLDHIYSAEAQTGVYKQRAQNDQPFYPLFFGRGLYPSEQFNEGLNILGTKNAMYPRFMATGDLRVAYASSDNGNNSLAEVATRLNLDLDLKLTATERIHAFVRPLDNNGKFSRFVFDGQGNQGKFQNEMNGDLEDLFFEGDLGAILSGISGSYLSFDLPFAVGRMPMIFQNGIWLNDIIDGIAFTLPAMNSPQFDISNMDVTFFAANNQVNSPLSAQLDSVRLYGFNAFIEMLNGYIELGYAYTEDKLLADGDQSYHNVMLSYSHRIGNLASVSYRVLHNFGQQVRPGQVVGKTADGTLVLFESSFITSKPYTLIPYLDLFYGFGRPQSVARVGGILQNTGIIFEADGLTGFPTLDATANDTAGGAIGLEYLFNLNQQIIVEAALVKILEGVGKPGRNAFGDQYGFAARYQLPLTKTILLRLDAMIGFREQQRNLWGARSELRWKF